MIAKFAGQCIKCGGSIPKGADVAYDPIARKVYHHNCDAANSETADEGAEALAERLGFAFHDEAVTRKLGRWESGEVEMPKVAEMAVRYLLLTRQDKPKRKRPVAVRRTPRRT